MRNHLCPRSPAQIYELVEAADKGDGQKCQQLLKSGADPNAKGPSGLTPLQSATYRGQAEVVTLLLKARADLEAKSDSGKTALCYAADNGHATVVTLLVKAGADAEEALKLVRKAEAIKLLLEAKVETEGERKE